MATLNINGRRVKVDDKFLSLSPEDQQRTVEEIAGSLGLGGPRQQPAPAEQAASPEDPYKARAQSEADKLRAATGGSLQASSGGLSSGLMFGFDDEIGAAVTAPFRALREGVGYGEAYKREAALNRAIKQGQREGNPVASTVGQVAGGLAGAGKAAASGLTTAGRFGTSTLARAGEGAAEGLAYGALYGAGDPGEGKSRFRGAAEGAAIGAGAGGVLGAGMGAIANRGARAAANKAAPTVRQLDDDARALYSAMSAENVSIKPVAAQRLASNVKYVSGRPNARLRPNTLGIVREFEQAAKQPMTLEVFDELRQGVNDALKTAKPGDTRTLMRIKEMMDNFARNMKPGDFTGDAGKAVSLLEQARGVYARKAKTELVESILDKAEVKSGQFSQSGMANAIKTVMRQTYGNKGLLKQFSKEEQALIRQMAMGGSNSSIVNLMAKFAPRGPVSAAISTMLGNAAMGPAGFVVGPAIGQAAARSADRSAVQALEALRRSAATGGVPQALPQIGRGANVLIAPATQQMQGLLP